MWASLALLRQGTLQKSYHMALKTISEQGVLWHKKCYFRFYTSPKDILEGNII